MAKLKVLHLIEALGSGGAERLLFTNLKHFERAKLENEVATVYEKSDFWRQSILDLGVPVSSLNCTGVKGFPAGLARLVRIMRRFRPDVVHTHLWAANILGRLAGRICGVPVVSSIHNPEYEPAVLPDVPSIRRKIRFAKFLDKKTAFLWCRKMIAVSEFIRESTNRNLGYPLSDIQTLYNPVDFPAVSFDPGRPPADRTGTTGTLLSVARISPQKGLIYLIRAMPEVIKAFPDVRVVSIGVKNDHPYLTALKEEIAKLGLQNSIEMLGERRDVAHFLEQCDIFVFPSLFEGLGIALAEAMAAGCACVSCEIRPLDEFVKSGVNGLSVSPRDPAKLAAAIIKLLQDPQLRMELGREARKTALELFEPRSAAERLTDIYSSVAQRSVK